MKKTFTILLLFVFFVTQVGYYFIMEFVREEYKENLIKSIIPNVKDEDLVSIGADNEKIDWVEESKEFRLENAMYDVVKISYTNGKKILHCLADGDEQKLLEKYNLVSKENAASGQSKNGKQTTTNILPDFIFVNDHCLLNFKSVPVSINYYYNAPHTIDITADILVPPPKA